MKRIIFFILTILSFRNAFSQGAPACPNITTGGTQTVCNGQCAVLTSTLVANYQTTSYTVSSIPYVPYPYTGTSILVKTDDVWSPDQNIGFNFCYFGNTYSKCVVGANGQISFNLNNQNKADNWEITTPLPNNIDLPGNTICGPFRDIDPAISGKTYYQIGGAAPCRYVVISWDSIPLYDNSPTHPLTCKGTPYSKFQIVMYENTNYIDVYIGNSYSCNQWNDGLGIIGIQNANATTAVCAPGRNATAFTAVNEAWRFTPTGAAAYNFNWIGPNGIVSSATTATVCPSISTTYTASMVLTDCGINTFTVTSTEQVTVLPSPTLSVNSGIICPSGSTDTLWVTGNASSYSWTPSTGLNVSTGTVVVASPTATTVYTVTGTSGSCYSSSTATVTLASNPAIIVNSTTLCTAGTGTLLASGANTYTWSPALGLSASTGSSVVASPTATTIYTVTGSVGSCSVAPATATVTIISSIAVTVNSPTICIGDTAKLLASGANTYTWSPAKGLSATTGSLVTATPTLTATYTVTGQSGGCTSSATSTISIVTIPTFTVNPATICSGTPASLIASNTSLTYTWVPSINTIVSSTTDTALVSPSTTTVYTVTGATGSCISKPVIDSVKVKISPTITVLNPTVCVGTTATITATGATSYTWSPLTNLTSSITSDTVYISNPVGPMTYSVVGSSANGCTGTAVSNITTGPNLGIVSGTPIIRCYGDYIQLAAAGGSTYTWTPTPSNPSNIAFVNNNGYTVVTSTANVGTYSIAIYAESYAGQYCNGRDTVVLTINPTPTITVLGNASPSICNGSSTTLTAVSSGTNTVTYNWSPAGGLNATTGNPVIASPSVTSTYTAIGTNSSGCSAAAVFTVNVTPVPSFTVNNAAFCNGGSALLNVSPTGANSYTWSPSGGLSSITGASVSASPSVTTTYTVTGINTNTVTAFSCYSKDTSIVTIYQSPKLTASAFDSTICLGAGDTLSVSGALSYTWSPATSLNSISGNMVIATPTAAVNPTYTITGATYLGCTNTTTVTFTVNPVPNYSVNVSKNVLCSGDSSVFQIVSLGTPTVPATYTWGPATGLHPSTGTLVTATPTTSPGASYLVIATAIKGACTAPKVVNLVVNPLPTINAAPPLIACLAQHPGTLTATGAGVSGTYVWSPASTLSSSTGSTVYATATSTGTTQYTVTGTDAKGCAANTVVTLTVNPVPTVTAIATPTLVCEGKPITLTGSTSSIGVPSSYEWAGPNNFIANSAAATVPSATVIGPNTYSFGITINYCTGYAYSIVNVVQTPTITTFPVPTLCSGTTTTLTVNSSSASTTFTWSPAATITSSPHGNSVTVDPSSTTIYTVKGSDQGCPAAATATTQVTVNTLNAIISWPSNPATGDIPFNASFANGSTNGPGTIYTWDYGNGTNIQTTTSVSDSGHTVYPNVGTYQVILSANNPNSACLTQRDTLTVIVTETYSLTIPNVFTPNGDGLNDGYYVTGKGVQSFDILIYDRWGLKMFESSTLGLGGAWDGKNASDGTYFYIIKATSTKGVSQDYRGYLTLIK